MNEITRERIQSAGKKKKKESDTELRNSQHLKASNCSVEKKLKS